MKKLGRVVEYRLVNVTGGLWDVASLASEYKGVDDLAQSHLNKLSTFCVAQIRMLCPRDFTQRRFECETLPHCGALT